MKGRGRNTNKDVDVNRDRDRTYRIWWEEYRGKCFYTIVFWGLEMEMGVGSADGCLFVCVFIYGVGG